MDGIEIIARFIALENMVAAAVANSPQRAEICKTFDSFSAQQLAMQCANGSSSELTNALRVAFSDLSRLALGLSPGQPSQ